MIADNSGASGRLHCDLRRDKSTSLGPTPLPPFNYEPLPDRCIRVLELQPGERADPFRGRFTIISIDGEDKFDALSYMWGDASPVDYIIFDGAAIPVAWNLARALEYLRDQQGSEVHRIWIDAVCINQKDDKERGRQVAMMRSVYNKADCVRIWINAPDLEEESKAVAALKSFELGAEGLNFNLGAEELNFGLGDDIKFWEPVKPIFKNEYWNRLWIRHDLADRDILIDMLSGTFHLNSSRIHDRLYAIMHLADDFQENDIEADYNKTASQIMLDAADHHIRLHRNIRFLDRSFRSDFDKIGYLEHNSECSFPTWVPRRWLGSNPYGQPMGSAQESRGHPHEAAVNEQLDKKKLFTTCAPDSVDMTHMRLRVRGMKVGEIRTVLSLPIQRVADGMTVAQFWSSSLGQHIGSYLCREERQIPLGIVQALSRRWPNENFNYEDAVSGLMWFYDCSTRPDLADRRIGIVGQLIDALLAPLRDHINGSAAVRATTHIVLQLRQRKCILTGKDQFGLVPECNIRAEDEIWMLLGHPTPCVLRKQPNGTYEYICNARIPVLMDDIVGHIDIRRFSTKAVPGEQIGEWTIEDIELI
ncbi:hypothetical protein CC77DRAFT_1044284 [Alternaria alternata]|uniref:Heterokaryon incompatibility domain-containing protein n=1 Tax=Alternaria alternata TaxID=5599 RepID=A0A177D5Z8_ALTAL|nr:hypothetical protein CC77DRAFT_1044284 [Alternaria alternata]OAG15143.1 hypothetical protein CC77DRAFT_1044284 [Alternaria alternata]